MMTVKLNDREFTQTLRRYADLSKRDPKQITDTKAYFIARGATRLTHKASAQRIRAELGRIVNSRKGRYLKLSKADKHETSLAEAILRSRAHRRGDPQPTKAEIAGLIERFIGARLRSVAFIKSGWLGAIKRLAPLAIKRGAPRQDASARQYGAAKGYAIPANPGWRARTSIVNTADAKHDEGNSLDRYGTPGLKQAVENERLSMLKYIRDKMVATAKKAGVRVR